ncbi:MAG TPA: glycosyltransferase, partial [Candidatus Synoicihabitans sp.]|nr:glycosyltransferase [Candidatus Synoicihabitans sp.]
VLLGHESETSLLDEVDSAIVAAGGERPRRWLGRDGELPLLAALLATCRAYVGHDTGAMHIAAAVGRPTVGIFGGGHWPRFRPVGRQVAAVVHPLPCFGCNWDCYFGNAPCVKLLEVPDVLTALERVLSRSDAPVDEVVEVNHLPSEARDLIAAATPRYRALQRDRLDRQHKIEEFKAESDDKDREIGELKQAAEERKIEMESIKAELEAECASKDNEIAELKAEADSKDAEIEGLKRETNGKDAEIDALKRETNSKDLEIAQLKREADGKDVEIAAIKQTANEREQLIITLDGHVRTFQAIVADKDQHIANLDQDRTVARAEGQQLRDDLANAQTELAATRARLEERETILSRLPADAADWSKALHDKEVHIQNLETMIRHLHQQIGEQEASLANYAARRDAVEAVKYFGQQLAQKEAVIQTLHQACKERETLIGALALEAAGLGRLQKVWRATIGFWRLKISAPFSTWLFRRTVEQYWMQIGILQHYAPRAVRWDKRMRKHLRRPVAQLPIIGIVTPSYGQATFIESTMLSVLNQRYPKLRYVVQDGGSKDATPEIIQRYADRLHAWECAPDRGQADAVAKGFAKLDGELQPNDVMGWLNSDDLLAPRTLATVADYFARHPDVDVIYGHRI